MTFHSKALAGTGGGVGHWPGCSSSEMQLWGSKAEPDCREHIPSLSYVLLPAEQNHSESIFLVNISLFFFWLFFFCCWIDFGLCACIH